jgi:glycosyltransferase involved in cell wall biosynthesis
MTTYFVSIIICTHNRPHLLPQAVTQVRAQDYPRDAIEIVVVDNRSTDNTRHVVDQLAAEPGIPLRYVYEPQPGVTFARNRGAQEARHPYVAYFDDDCTAEPNWLRELVVGFDLGPNVVAVGGLVRPQWETQPPSWVGSELEPYFGSTGFLGTYPRLLNKDERIVEFNMALKREAWQATDGFLGMEQFGSRHMAAGEGLHLLDQLRHCGGQIAFVPDAVMYHQVRWRATQRWMLERAYWQGVSNSLLQALRCGQLPKPTVRSVGGGMRTCLSLLGKSMLSYVKGDDAVGMVHLAGASAYLGWLASAFRLVGDWDAIRESRPSQ